MSNNTILVKKLVNDAIIPKRATEGSAGYDLYSYEDGTIDSLSQQMISTKISMNIPEQHCGLIWSRSGLSARSGIETGAGVIDSDYRGEIKVILHNHSDKKFCYKKGMRIAQMLIMPVITPKLVENNEQKDEQKAEQKNEKKNEREDKGFGSSGLY